MAEKVSIICFIQVLSACCALIYGNEIFEIDFEESSNTHISSKLPEITKVKVTNYMKNGLSDIIYSSEKVVVTDNDDVTVFEGNHLIYVIGSGSSVTVLGGPNNTVLLSGNHNNIHLIGDGNYLQVTGSNNTISLIGDTASTSIEGHGNNIDSNGAQSNLTISGSDNFLSQVGSSTLSKISGRVDGTILGVDISLSENKVYLSGLYDMTGSDDENTFSVKGMSVTVTIDDVNNSNITIDEHDTISVMGKKTITIIGYYHDVHVNGNNNTVAAYDESEISVFENLITVTGNNTLNITGDYNSVISSDNSLITFKLDSDDV